MTSADADDQPRGVLHYRQAPTGFALERRAPDARLAELVEFYWQVCWDLRGRSPHEQQVLSHPNLHLVFERSGAEVHGVNRGLFVRRLEGRGQVLGIKFRPGGFRPFWGRPVQELADRVLPATEVFGPAVADAGRRILTETDPDAMARLADAFLLARMPPADPLVPQVAAMVDTATADRAIVRVEQLAARCQVSVRSLQRLFAEYVGVGPKWVLRRARLQEAALRAEAGTVDWPLLAADLGYADQAHLTRDFTAVVGLPPTRYAPR